MARPWLLLICALAGGLTPGAALLAEPDAELPAPAKVESEAVTLSPLTGLSTDAGPALPAAPVLEVAIAGLDDLAGTRLVLVDGRSGAPAAALQLTTYSSSPVALPVANAVLEGHLELHSSSGILARWPLQGEAPVLAPSTAPGQVNSGDSCLLALDSGHANRELPAACSLREATLADLDLRGMDLSYRDLSRADLRSSSLDDCNLRGATLDGALLQGATLEGADLSGASLVAADLTGASLFVADLGGANLHLAVLRQANLVNANLANAMLIGADLTGANLAGAVFSGADLTDAICPDGLANRATAQACRQ